MSHKIAKFQNIVVGSVYCKPKSKAKKKPTDHIYNVYHEMNRKYSKGLHRIIAGDTNDLKIDPILQLSPNLKQVVKSPTRCNPDRILDVVITSLGHYYQEPNVFHP